MASTPFKKVLPPHLRMRAAQPAVPVTLDPVTPLTVVYGNLVGNETIKEPEPEPEPKTTKPELKPTEPEPDNTKREPETLQPVDRAMAEAWWTKLSGEHKIGIAESYILEGRELPTVSVHKPATKPGLNPTVPSFTMGALREVVPNVLATAAKQDGWGSLSFPATVAKQDEWGSSSFPATIAKQDEWRSSSAAPVKPTLAPVKTAAAPVKVDDWNFSPIQSTTNGWGSSSAAPAKPTPTPVKTAVAPVRAAVAPVKLDDWNVSPTQATTNEWGSSSAAPVKPMHAPVKAAVAPVKAAAAPVEVDDWNISSAASTKQGNWNNTTSSMQQDDWSTPTASQPLISIDQESPTVQTNETLVQADKVTPPRKSAWIGLKSNGEEQDEFIKVNLQTFLGHVHLLTIIQFMTAKVFPRLSQLTPKKPALDTTYVIENPDPAPADDDAAIVSNNFSSDW